MSAIFVKIPPAILRALAPRDSPMAKPMKLGPTRSFGRNTRIQIMKKSSTLTRRSPTLMPEVRGILTTSTGFPVSDAKAVLEFAMVLILMPNHATPYEPRMPKIEHTSMISIFPKGAWDNPMK
ncbi:MAG: hypothetical protein A4E64_02549 [Syntrophorhabdus sp. PtaU1.Bin058]|nr:MAG: hypothetical protein A4E64_02549 [Syntrophorhabdus sp. PtaU1.Bin058]